MGRYLEICDAITRGRWAERARSMLATVTDDGLRADLRYQFEERAAICEHDGGMSRAEAEWAAFEELKQAMKELEP